MKLWTVVSDDPHGLIRNYREMWGKLQDEGGNYYFKVRDDFNRCQDPYLFFFLLRTCRTGLVRFNQASEFNSGFHDSRPGMSPERVESLVARWRQRLDGKNVHFFKRDYREVASKTGDLLYLDPPYQNETNRYYSGLIDFTGLFKWLRHQRGEHLLSLNGFLGDDDRTISVPADLYRLRSMKASDHSHDDRTLRAPDKRVGGRLGQMIKRTDTVESVHEKTPASRGKRPSDRRLRAVHEKHEGQRE
jgi:DNA adenine methylase